MGLEKVIEAVVSLEETMKKSRIRNFFPYFDPFVNRDGTVWVCQDWGTDLAKDVDKEDLLEFVQALEDIVAMLKPVAAKQVGVETITRYITVQKNEYGYMYHDHDTAAEAMNFDETGWADCEVVGRCIPVTLKV